MADIAKAVRRIRSRQIENALRKTDRMNLLVTPQQKEEIRVAADRYGLSMTDHLSRLHLLVEARTHSRG